MPDLFAFEVPTSAGSFRIIGPDTLPRDEAVRVGERIAALIPLLVLEPDPLQSDADPEPSDA